MNLVELLEKRAAAHPERPAIVDRVAGADREVSYGELWRRVSEGAGFLTEMGLRRGMTVLAFHPVRIELYEFLLAAFHQGIRVMLADPSAGKGFLSLCCRRLQPDGFFGSWKAQLLRWAVPELRGVKVCLRNGPWFPGATAWRGGARAGRLDLPDEEAALVTFTSGSTGVPKAAVRTHGFLLAQHRVLSKSLDFEEGEVDLITLPVFVLANLASGLTSVLAATDLARPGAPDVDAVVKQCGRFGVTRCAASPAFFEGFLKAGRMPDFRKVYTGGAPVFPDVLRRMECVLPEARVEAVYGSTEAEPICHVAGDGALAGMTARGAGLCAGRPVDEIELRILREQWGTALGPYEVEDFEKECVERGEAGEIVVSGEHVLAGYLDGVGNGETKIRVGEKTWHRTGDAGWMDEEGRVWLLGRCSEKLPEHPAAEGFPREVMRYPFAVECAMRERFQGIRMAALAWEGERCLVVGKRCGEKEAGEIRAAADEFGMARVRFVDALPLDRRHNAKVDYPELRRMLEVSGGRGASSR